MDMKYYISSGSNNSNNTIYLQRIICKYSLFSGSNLSSRLHKNDIYIVITLDEERECVSLFVLPPLNPFTRSRYYCSQDQFYCVTGLFVLTQCPRYIRQNENCSANNIIFKYMPDTILKTWKLVKVSPEDKQV